MQKYKTSSTDERESKFAAKKSKSTKFAKSLSAPNESKSQYVSQTNFFYVIGFKPKE